MKYPVTIHYGIGSPDMACHHQHRTETGALRCALDIVIRRQLDAATISSDDGTAIKPLVRVLRIGD